MGASIDCCARFVPAAQPAPAKHTDKPAGKRSPLSRFSPREGPAGPDGIGTALAIPSLGEGLGDRRWAPFRLALSPPTAARPRPGKSGRDKKERRPSPRWKPTPLTPGFALHLDVAPQGLKTKPGPIITLSGILGRSSNSSGFFCITFKMCLGSMCLLTSKVALSTPRRSKVSCALQSAR